VWGFPTSSCPLSFLFLRSLGGLTPPPQHYQVSVSYVWHSSQLYATKETTCSLRHPSYNFPPFSTVSSAKADDNFELSFRFPSSVFCACSVSFLPSLFLKGTFQSFCLDGWRIYLFFFLVFVLLVSASKSSHRQLFSLFLCWFTMAQPCFPLREVREVFAPVIPHPNCVTSVVPLAFHAFHLAPPCFYRYPPTFLTSFVFRRAGDFVIGHHRLFFSGGFCALLALYMIPDLSVFCALRTSHPSPILSQSRVLISPFFLSIWVPPNTVPPFGPYPPEAVR